MKSEKNLVLIHAIGTAVPEYKISQEKHHSLLDTANEMQRAERLQLRSIYQRSGITSRHSVINEFDKNK